MIGGLLRFVLFRVFGARVLLVLTVLGWIRNRLGNRSSNRDDPGTGKPVRRVG